MSTADLVNHASGTILCLAGIFDLLSIPGRLQILWFLARRRQPSPVGYIASELAMPEPTVSKHLLALWQARLVNKAEPKAHINGQGRATLVSEGYCIEAQALALLAGAEEYIGISAPGAGVECVVIKDDTEPSP